MQVGWSVKAAQCSAMCVLRVWCGVCTGAVWCISGGAFSCRQCGGTCRWCIACRHMAGPVRVVRSYIDAMRVVRADIGAVHSDIGALHCGYRFMVHRAAAGCVVAAGRRASNKSARSSGTGARGCAAVHRAPMQTAQSLAA